jgi:hypothetical protein
LKAFVETFGPDFLNDPELEQYEALKTEQPEKAAALLQEHASPHIEPLWYFTVCLARHLQSGENRLSSTDAYWIGAVDEVVGTSLTGVRHEIERDAGAP